MKNHKTWLVSFLLSAFWVLLLWPSSLTVSATDSQTELLSQIEEALNVSVFYEKGTDRLIKCFDVSETGCYAIGYKNNTIQVYDSLGVFQFGYCFDTDGTYGIVLKENSMIIYLGRSNIAVEIDPAGKCVAAEKIYFSKEVVDDIFNRTYKHLGKTNYYLERDVGIFNGDYSRLVKIDETGKPIILYDVTARGYFAGISHYIILSIFPIAGIVFVAVKVTKEKYKSDESEHSTHE